MPNRTVVIGSGCFDLKKHPNECQRYHQYGNEGREDTLVASLVLEHTLLSKSKRPEDFKILNTYVLDRPMLERNFNPTPFSLVRFWVPELCGFEGQAVYLDADMIVFDDIHELFDSISDERAVYRCGRESVLAMNCDQLKHWDVWKWRDEIDKGRRGYGSFMRTLAGEKSVGAGPPEWNHLDHWEEGTKLLHYTRLSMQPWRPASKHPHRKRWWRALREAVDAGHVSQEDLVCSAIKLPPVSSSA